MTTPTITIQLPVTLYDQLQQIAQQTQTDLVQVIQRLLSQHAPERAKAKPKIFRGTF